MQLYGIRFLWNQVQLMHRLARSRKDRKKVAIDQSGDVQSHITASLKISNSLHILNASLKQDAHIRYVYTCQVLDIRFLEMMYMEAVNRHIILLGRHYMPESSDLFIQEPGKYMEFEAPLPDYFQKILNDLESNGR